MNNEMYGSGSTKEPVHSITKVLRHLNVYADPEVLDAIILAIETRLADGWSRDRESEQILTAGDSQSRFFVFACPASVARRPSWQCAPTGVG